MYSIEKDAFVVVLGLLDSGARHNWISRDLVVRLGLCPVKLAEQADFEDFQGGVLTAYEHVKLNRYGKSKCTREGYFTVAEKGPFDIVIGSDFLFSEKVFTYNGTVLMNELNNETPGMSHHRSLLLVTGLTVSQNRRERGRKVRGPKKLRKMPDWPDWPYRLPYRQP